MEIRLAKRDDLSRLKEMYRNIIDKMNREKIEIWNEIFPCEFLQEDIEKNCLYIMEENNTFIASFSLLDLAEGAEHINWKNNEADALYIGKLGVNVDYRRRGIAAGILMEAAKLAKDKGADCLRLMVVDINTPAIKLYEKMGFKRAEGIYDLRIDDELVLHEFGYERRLR